MNKRARNRLMGVTAIIFISVVAIFLSVSGNDGAFERSVSDVVDNDELKGERLRVTGTVIPGSWDGHSSPMKFDIRDEGATSGPLIQVLYTGTVPSTFGDEVTAIVTGIINDEGVLEAGDMITKCPSKYESADSALRVVDLLDRGDTMVGTSVRLTGFVVDGTIVPPGSDVRFTISDRDGSPVIDVNYPDGALPDGMDDGSQVVLGGALDENGTFDAISVAIAE